MLISEIKTTHPLLSSLNKLTGRALAVPQVGTSEATVRDTRESGSGLEKIRVGTHEDIRHHGSRTGTRGEDTARVNAIVLDSVADHRGDSERVATLVMRESRCGVDIPASSRVGGVGVDDYETMRVGKVGVLSAGEVCLRCARAVVHGDNERRGVG